jgi:iron complex transport system substrate-binding protein
MISTPEARKRVNNKEIMELGNNGQLNTERVISLQPDVVVGFAVSSTNATLDKISSFGIPVVYNSDWLEKHPLGKAEWIKFFGVLTGKFEASVEFYNKIRKEYDRLKELAQKADEPPKVIAGAMLNEQWYLPYGNSWQAKFIKDANADYIYGYTEGKGSIALSFEKVFKKARDADVWVAPAQYTAYDKMKEDNRHYARFKAFKERNIHGFASTKGETGGVLFYEQAPNRPELVLKDLIHIFHPELLEDHENQFFKPLE